jgi:hypothetical protein
MQPRERSPARLFEETRRRGLPGNLSEETDRGTAAGIGSRALSGSIYGSAPVISTGQPDGGTGETRFKARTRGCTGTQSALVRDLTEGVLDGSSGTPAQRSLRPVPKRRQAR